MKPIATAPLDRPIRVSDADLTILPRRILIDGSHAMSSQLKTGVQRVVRSLIHEGIKCNHDCGSEVSGVVLKENRLVCYHPNQESSPTLRQDVLFHLPHAYIQVAQWLCRRLNSKKINKWLLPQPGHLGIFRMPVSIIEAVLRRGQDRPDSTIDLGLGHGDMLILPDAYWAKMEIWDHVKKARDSGVFTVVVVYDIIPLTHPQFVPRGATKAFKEYLRKVVVNADLIVAISTTICDQLRAELPNLFPNVDSFPQIEAFRMGADFDSRQGDSTEGIGKELTSLFGGTGGAAPYISVSTFDPRKNQRFTLEAFDRLWQHQSEVKLAFIGGWGWMSDELLQQIGAHPMFGTNLFVFHELSDADLKYCYGHARGTIMASFVEGFGLPIVESLWHGRKTFASDIPVHREVGGNAVTYFSLDSPDLLASAITRWELELSSGPTAQCLPVQPISWRESTKLLFERCLSAYGSRCGNAPNAAAVDYENDRPVCALNMVHQRQGHAAA